MLNTIDYQALYSKAISGLSGNIIRELTKRCANPGYISFAGGNPSPDTFPADDLKEIAAEVLTDPSYRTAALQYGASDGYIKLREYVAARMEGKGIQTDTSNVAITTGSQQSLDTLSKAFLNPGDRVLVENPTYVAALKIFGIYQADICAVESDDDGMIPESLEEKLSEAPAKFLYIIPNFQNPTGVTLTLERRKKIMEIAQCHNVIVIEDDPYGELRYSGEPLPALKTMDSCNQVVYLGSFSKVIAPGLRVAFLVAPAEITQKVVLCKQNNDMHTCGLAQVMIYEYCRRGLLDAHIEDCKNLYRKKRDLMLSLLEQHFPKEMTFTHPEGGLFLWAKLPEEVSSMDLVNYTLDHAKIAFIPGESFFACGGGENTMRLNFSLASPEVMESGLKKLGEMIKEYLAMKKSQPETVS